MESTVSETLLHVLLLARRLKKCDLQGVIIAALMELGVPTKSVGVEYRKRAILLQFEDPARALAKDIYLEITLHCKPSSEEQVNQALRDAGLPEKEEVTRRGAGIFRMPEKRHAGSPQAASLL